MLTALLVSMVVTCAKAQPHPLPVESVRCEGADRVRRDVFGQEVSRAMNACTVVRCEGTDWDRREYSGQELERRVQGCFRPAPVRLTTQPWKFGLSGRG